MDLLFGDEHRWKNDSSYPLQMKIYEIYISCAIIEFSWVFGVEIWRENVNFDGKFINN